MIMINVSAILLVDEADTCQAYGFLMHLMLLKLN